MGPQLLKIWIIPKQWIWWSYVFKIQNSHPWNLTSPWSGSSSFVLFWKLFPCKICLQQSPKTSYLLSSLLSYHEPHCLYIFTCYTVPCAPQTHKNLGVNGSPLTKPLLFSVHGDISCSEKAHNLYVYSINYVKWALKNDTKPINSIKVDPSFPTEGKELNLLHFSYNTNMEPDIQVE